MTQFQEAEDRFKAGIEAKHHRELTDAAQHFQAAIGLNPNFAEAYGELGAIRYAEGNNDDALELLRQAITLEPHLGNAHLFLALTLAEVKDHQAAESQFEKAILYSDQPAVAHAAFGNYLGVLKRPEAEQAFLSALEQDPECILALRDYARLLASQDRGEEAEAQFKKALQVDPDSAPTNFRYGKFLSCFDERCKEAVYHLRRALELDPRMTDAQEILDELAEEHGHS
jgi:tetratricopeptide (TPR) repeat protein